MIGASMLYSSTVIKADVNTNLSEIELIERTRLLGSTELLNPESDYIIRAAFYRRVSTGPQADDDKASISEQQTSAMKIIKQNGWQFIKEYADIKATSYEENAEIREGLSQALEDAKKGLFDVLIVWIDSRLGRNSSETGKIRNLFKTYGVQIYSVKKPLPVTDPRFYNPKRDKFKRIYEGVNDLFSEAESAEFAERMEFGKMNKAMHGKIPCGVPYGYKKLKEYVFENGKQKSISKAVAIEEELLIVSQIFDMYLHQCLGIRKIVETLNGKSLKAPRGGLWDYSSLRYILKNPTYAGKVRWGWRLSDSRISRQRLLKGHTGVITQGEHQSIISVEDFVKIQKKIQEKVKIGGRAVSSRGLLTGVLKCGICGGNAYTTSHPSSYAYKKFKEGKPKENYSRVCYYVCSTVSKYGNSACKRYIGSQAKIDGLVIEEIKKLANSETAQKSFENRLKQNTNKELKSEELVIKDKLKKIPDIRHRYAEAYGKGVMNLEEYGKMLAQLNNEETKLNSELLDIQNRLKESEMTREKVEKAIKAFRDFDLIWDKASFEKKKDLISSIIEKAACSKNKIKIDYKI